MTLAKILQSRLNKALDKCSLDTVETERDAALEALFALRDRVKKDGITITFQQISNVMKIKFGYCPRAHYSKEFIEAVSSRREARRDAIKKLEEMGEL